MKKLSLNIKISLLLLLLTMVEVVQASPIGFVRSIRGNAFSLYSGKMKVLAIGDTIEDFCEVYTEEGSEIVLADYRDHSMHLSGGSHIKMLKGMIELQKGYLWITSVGGKNSNSELFILTANAQVIFKNGEAVVSYDYSLEKTQALSIVGKMSLANSKLNYLTEEIPEGHFSFVSKKYNEGTPRIATPVGEKSFKSIVALFDIPKDKSPSITAAKREVASVVETKPNADQPVVTKPMLSRKEESKDLTSKYMSQLKQEKKRRIAAKKALAPLKKSSVKIIMYGFDGNLKAEPPVIEKPMVNTNKINVPVARKSFQIDNEAIKVNHRPTLERLPASQSMDKSVNSTFEDSLKSQYKAQPKHNSDINKLINELQNIDQDYSPQH